MMAVVLFSLPEKPQMCRIRGKMVCLAGKQAAGYLPLAFYFRNIDVTFLSQDGSKFVT